MTLPLVYIAGPYSGGDVVENIRTAVSAGEMVRRRGWVPFVPHLYHLWHLVYPHDYEFWLALDMDWLRRCDVLWRLLGESPGADREIEFCEKNGIAVVRNIQELDYWVQARDEQVV